MAVASSAEGDAGLEITYDRCATRTGPERPLPSLRMSAPDPERKLAGSRSKRSAFGYSSGRRIVRCNDELGVIAISGSCQALHTVRK